MSGSLPIGLLVGWLLLQLAGTGALTAAILLPLYYLADATITLLRRLARREKVWEAHRSHFYQQATDNGFSALAVSAHVFGLNLALAALAACDDSTRPAPPCRSRRFRIGCRPRRPALLRRFATEPASGAIAMNAPLIALTGATGLHRPPSPARSCRSAAIASACCCAARAEVPAGASSARHRRHRLAAQHGGGVARRGRGDPFGGPRPRHVGPAGGRLPHHQHGGDDALARAAERAGVKRFVFLSSIRAQTGPVARAS